MSFGKYENTFKLAWNDIDPTLLPADARELGSNAFRRAVADFLARQFESLGKARAVFDDASRSVEVTWTQQAPTETIEDAALGFLNRGQHTLAIPLLKALMEQNPEDPTWRLNLGMVYSDQGRLQEASLLLHEALRLRPDDPTTLVAIGVVHGRAGDLDEAIRLLRKAAAVDPANPYVHQNLGGCLLKQGAIQEAEEHLRNCLRLQPENRQAGIGLAQALESQGKLAEADDLYQDILEATAESVLVGLAQEGRTRIAHANLRRAGQERPDVVMYCLGSLERFDAMTSAQVQAVGHEIAILGMKGLDINDPARKYRLRSLPGEFSGLHLVSMMYTAFQQIAPETDVGIDLAGEYEAALALHRERRAGR